MILGARVLAGGVLAEVQIEISREASMPEEKKLDEMTKGLE